MKRSIITLLLVLFALGQVQAQKIYSTKAAKVRFIAVDDKDIDATNTKAVSRLETNGNISFIMLMKDFSFEMDLMQKHFNEEYVESDKFPRGIFNGQITNIKSVNFAKDGSYPIIVNGNMQVHGVNKAIQTNGVIVISFGIGGVLIKMVADQVDVEVVANYQ
ncbi:MAG: YceI family protein [Chitinophagia bacterium]|nr:YceI family protein [Chitinophagia bacterium]